jgi:protein-disulfide isomerase
MTTFRRARIPEGVVVTIIVVILTATGCGSRKSSETRAIGTGAEIASLLAGIPQHGNTLGDPKAPLTLEYFGDLQCPFCKQFTLGTLRLLVQRYVRGGRLKIEYRSLESATRDPNVFETQQVAALAAGEQNKMWNFIELFYYEQGEENGGYVTEGFLQGLARQVPGLNLLAWTAARNDAALANTIASDARTAHDAGIMRTPSFLIGGPTRPPYTSAIEGLLRS